MIHRPIIHHLSSEKAYQIYPQYQAHTPTTGGQRFRQRLARPEQMRLPDDFGDISRPDAVGEGRFHTPILADGGV